MCHRAMMHDKEGRKVLFYNQGSYMDGGGTSKGFANKLEVEGGVKDRNQYDVMAYSLHALNLCLSSSPELTMGPGDPKRTTLQLLH